MYLLIYLFYSLFQLLESAVKVEGWLSQQEPSDTTESTGKNLSIQFIKTWSLDHIKSEPGIVKRRKPDHSV